MFDPGSVVNEMLPRLHRGEAQEQRQEPMAQDSVSGIIGPGENAAPENPVSSGKRRLVQKESR